MQYEQNYRSQSMRFAIATQICIEHFFGIFLQIQERPMSFSSVALMLSKQWNSTTVFRLTDDRWTFNWPPVKYQHQHQYVHDLLAKVKINVNRIALNNSNEKVRFNSILTQLKYHIRIITITTTKTNERYCIFFIIGGARPGGPSGPAGKRSNTRQPAKPVSAEELDAELDAYVNDMKL